MNPARKQYILAENLGGVQGSAPGEASPASSAPPGPIREVPEQPATDAGEIEWAGALVKKPPAPAN